MTTPPSTPAIERVRSSGLPHRIVFYGRVASAEEAAERRGVPLAALAKTLVVRVEEGRYVLVLIPGDSGLDYPKLRTVLGVCRLTMPSPEEALAATGYERGTINPIEAGGWPAIVDRRLTEAAEVSLGSGAHGWAIHLTPPDLVALVDAQIADITKPADPA